VEWVEMPITEERLETIQRVALHARGTVSAVKKENGSYILKGDDGKLLATITKNNHGTVLFFMNPRDYILELIGEVEQLRRSLKLVEPSDSSGRS